MDRIRQRPDVLVVGRGIIASAVALRLARDARHVAMIGPAPHRAAGVASLAAGAMLGGLGEVTRVPDDEREALALDIRLRAVQRYPQWLDEIGGFAAGRGTFVVASSARPQDLVAADAIEFVARERGLPCERVAVADAPGLVPATGHPPGRVLFLADEAWVDAPALLERTGAAALATGRVEVVDDEAVTLVERDGSVRGVVTAAHGPIEAPFVVLCAGSGVTPILERTPALAGVVPAVLSGKGVGLCLRRSTRPTTARAVTNVMRTPNRDFACGLHVVPRDDGIYLGATNRLSRYPGMTGEVTAGEIMVLVRRAARELVADIGTWNVTAVLHGERPLSADGLPLVGSPGVTGLLLATGTYRNGILLAPLVADLIADEIAGGAADPRLVPGPAREGLLTESAADVLAAGLAEYAQLVRDPDEPPLEPPLEDLLAALGRLVLDDGARSRRIRDELRTLLDDHPLVELVPEALIEMCLGAAGDS